MRFSKIFSPLLLLSTGVVAQSSGQEVTNALGGLTGLAENLVPTLQTLVDPAQLAQVILSGVEGLTSTCLKDVQNLGVGGGSARLTGHSRRQGDPVTISPGEQEVCEELSKAINQFILIERELLNIVIGKGDVLASIPAISPIAGVIRNLRACVLRLLSAPVDLCGQDIQPQTQELQTTLEKAVSAYSVN